MDGLLFVVAWLVYAVYGGKLNINTCELFTDAVGALHCRTDAGY